VQVQALRLEHHQQHAANATVPGKCDEFVRACSAKWLLHKRVIDAVERARALRRHVPHARARVASLRKFHIQSKFLPVSIVVKHCGSQARVL
jgi:hypothetical protein